MMILYTRSIVKLYDLQIIHTPTYDLQIIHTPAPTYAPNGKDTYFAKIEKQVSFFMLALLVVKGYLDTVNGGIKMYE